MTRIALALELALSATHAAALTISVPAQKATIQAAIDAAAPNDTITVAAGRYCGATVTKPVKLVGVGNPIIGGCTTSPTVGGTLRVGLLLDGAGGTSPASGTSVSGFVFDGAGVSARNTAPLAFGILARFASRVTVTSNTFRGTVQAVTNTAGKSWLVARNTITGLTLLDCTVAERCGGGDGIVFQAPRGGLVAPGGPAAAVNRPTNNVALLNRIDGSAPAAFGAFSMAGIFVMAADNTLVSGNVLGIRGNPSRGVAGNGVLVSNVTAGGATTITPGCRNTVVIGNDGRTSDYVLDVEGAAGVNGAGLVEAFNRGKVLRQDLTPLARLLAFRITTRLAAAATGAARAAPSYQ